MAWVSHEKPMVNPWKIVIFPIENLKIVILTHHLGMVNSQFANLKMAIEIVDFSVENYRSFIVALW